MLAQEALQRARDGDRNALDYLLQKHRDLAFSIALKYLKNPADAEDIVQDAFIRIFLNIRKFRNEAAFSTWLFKIVYCEAIRHINKQQRVLTIKEEVKAGENATEAGIYLKERAHLVKDAMQCLSANEYMVINLFYLLEKSLSEIEEITGQSRSNIKVLLHRARKRIEEYFNAHGKTKNEL